MKMAITKAILLLLLLAPLSQSSTNSTLSVGCIDDSDCVPLGHEYACYFYRCLNWMGGADTGLQHCSRDWQCGAGSRCYRHHNLREVSAGICFPASQLETCRSHEECEGETPHCCGMWCCPPLYYRQWQNFSCVTDMQCRTWNTGSFCSKDSKCGDQEEQHVVEVDDARIDEQEKEELWETVVNVDEAMVGILEETETVNMVEEVTEIHSLAGMEIMGDAKVDEDDEDEVEEDELEGENEFDEAVHEEVNDQKIEEVQEKVIEKNDSSLMTSENQIRNLSRDHHDTSTAGTREEDIQEKLGIVDNWVENISSFNIENDTLDSRSEEFQENDTTVGYFYDEDTEPSNEQSEFEEAARQNPKTPIHIEEDFENKSISDSWMDYNVSTTEEKVDIEYVSTIDKGSYEVVEYKVDEEMFLNTADRCKLVPSVITAFMLSLYSGHILQ